MKYFSTPLLRVAVIMIVAIASWSSAYATNFIVANLNDSGAGSLRQAIIDANADAGAPHTISFSVMGIITINSPLPAFIRDIDVDGGGTITVNANGGDINRDIFTLNAGSSGSTLKGMTLDGTGTEAIQINAALSNVTIENMTIQSKLGGECNCINHGIYVGGAATNMMIKNVTIKDVQYGAYWAIRFVSTATNVTIDGLMTGGVSDIGGGDSRGIQFQGVASNITIQNTVIDLNDKNSGNDGNYGIYFNTNVTGLMIDNLTMDDAEVYSLYIGGSATTVSITNSTFENFNGYGGYPMIRFNGVTNGLTMTNVLMNADQNNTTDDANYCLYFYNTAQNISITGSTFKEADVAAIWFQGVNKDNITISGNTFTKNGYGADGQGGIIFTNTRNTTSDGGAVLITNNTFSGTNGEAIGVYPGNTGNYVIPNFTISNNTIYNTKSNYGAINVQYVDKVVITQNSIYNNKGRGIELTYAGNGGYEGTKTPKLVSSTPNGVNTYDLQITMPTICAGGICNVEIYVSEPQHYGTGGQTYVTTLTGLSSGTSTHTISCGAAPCGDGMNSPYGVWTATLRIPSNNFGTSEFSNKLPVQPNGPACVNSGVKLWLRADLGLYDQNLDIPSADGVKLGFWEDFSGGGGPSSTSIINDPKTKLVGINYNPVADMDNDVIRGHFSPAQTWVNTNQFTTVAAFKAQTNIGNGDRLFVLYSNGSYDYNTNAAQIEFYRTGNNIHSYRGNTLLQPAIPGVGNAFGNAGVFSSVTNSSSHTSYYNGNSQGTSAYAKGNLSAEQWMLGGGYTTNWCCGAEVDFGEVITYNRELTVPELQKVESYLAIKYGTTLNHDYIASNNTTLWSIATNTGYNIGIAGLAKDACSVLEQKQSRAETPRDVIAIAVGDSIAISNVENENSITNNFSALLWGDNGLTTLYDQTILMNPYSDTRMKRIWRVQKSNWADQNITVCVDGGNPNKTLLISAGDPTFMTITHYKSLNAKGCVTFNSVDLANGAYFTFGNRVVGPACVTTGIQGWYRADDGSATGASWLDYSGQDHHAVQAAAASQAASIANGINYNEALDFDGSNDYMDIAHGLGISGTNNFTVIGMGMRQAVSTWDAYLAQPGINTGDFLFGPASTNKTGLGRTNQSSVFGTGTYATANVPQFVSATRSGSTFNFFSNGAADGSATATYSFNVDNSRIGNRGASGDLAYNGYISEVIVYNRALSALELQKVHSYLALKYGVTLGTGTTDYVASNWNGATGTKMWTAADNAGYGFDIAGIGKDTCANFHQRQAKSINSDNLFSIALGDETATNNTANTYDVTNNLSFLVWSNNNLVTTFTTNVTSTNATLRMPRVWKVDKTNFADTLATLCYTGTDAINLYLLIASDVGFTTITSELPVDKDTKCVGLNTSLLADASYFTFAKEIKGPGCVNSNIKMWLRADDQTSTGALWQDYSGISTFSGTSSGTSQPVLNTSYVNFNPAFVFDGSNDFFNVPASLKPAGGNYAYTYFGVSLYKNASTSTFSIDVGEDGSDPQNVLIGHTGITHWHTCATSPGGACWYSNSNPATIDGNIAESYRAANSPIVNTQNNGGTAGAASRNAYGGGAVRISVGRRGVPGGYFGGGIAEVIFYDRTLTAAERQQVRSYLAIKYGQTLHQSPAQDYIASDGVTKMWTAADNTGYGNDIAGIGKDECTNLHQKQSKSINSDAMITMAVGSSVALSNAENLNEVLTDNTYLVWSNDNGATNAFSTAIPKTGINSTDRMARIWKVDKSVDWTDQEITICATQGGSRYLLIDTNSNGFDNDANTTEYKFNATTGCVTLNSAALLDGAYFTLATKKSGPACVNSGIVAWFRADYGATGSQWVDFSGNSLIASQSVVTAQPTSTLLNFNNALSFDGGDYLQIPNSSIVGKFPFGNAARTMISVGFHTNANDQYTFGYGTNVGSQSYGIRTYSQIAAFDGWGNNLDGTANSYPVNVSEIITARHNGTTTFLDVNGRNDKSGAKTLNTNSTREAQIGRFTSNNRNWNGAIGEVILYNRALSTGELQQVNSYLALKYGITLDQTTPTNYIASDGTTKMWDATANATYKYDIAGIGRDDCTELHQKQSKSVNTGSVLTMALGDAVDATNAENTDTVLIDNTYLVWGHNNGSTDFNVSLSGTDATARMARTWRVDKSATWGDQDITVCFDGQDDQSYLVIDNTDAAFGSVDKEHQLDATGCVTILSSDLTDGAYFTVGKNIVGPACVNGGILAWLRADDGISSGALWNDYSNNSNFFEQTVAGEQPTALTGSAATNFNPAFNLAAGDNFQKTVGLLSNGGGTVVAAVMHNNVAAGYAEIYNQNIDDPSVGKYTGSGNPLVWDNGVYTANGITTIGQYINNQNHLATFDYGSTASSWTAYLDGKSHNITHAAIPSIEAGIGYIGGENTGETWLGNIYEVAFYNRELSATELQLVHSYLAIKYGITINQSTPTNYLASDSSFIWKASDNTGYGNDIAGIGRDDCTGLNQKQSRSNDSDAIFTMASGTTLEANNTANTEDINNDKSFLVWSNDNASTNFTTDISAFGLTPGVRTPRIWKVDKTNWSDEELTICVNQTGERYLIIDTDASDAPMNEAADLAIYKFNISTGCITINSGDLADGSYFSLGTNIAGPACVNMGIKMWLRADYGALPGSWGDFSGNKNGVSQAVVAQQPGVLTNAINFNPALDFDGSNDVLTDADGILGGSTYSNVNAFVVSIQDVQQNSSIFQEGNVPASNYLNAHINWSDGRLYWDAGNISANNRFSFVHSLTNAVPYMYSLTAATGTGQKIFKDGKQVASDATMANFTGNNRPMYIGQATYSGGYYYNGKIAEIAIYTGAITAAQRQKIESYLALKYGLTMSSDNDGDNTTFEVANAEGLSEGDYVANDGTVYWDASVNTAYHNDVAGIGKDECTELNQKQSKSVNADDFVTMSLGAAVETTNAANTNEIVNDISFLLWGNNDGTTDFSAAVTATGSTVRMNRIWKVKKTNWQETSVTVCFDGYGSQDNEYLLTSASSTFATITAEHKLDANGCVNIQTDDLPDNGYFTIGKALVGPGCVNQGIRTWQRADDGTSTITDWFDASGNANTATQAVVADQTTALVGSESTAINYNPGFLFESTVDFFDYNNNLGLAGTGNNSVIWVANSIANTAATQAVLSHSGTGSNLFLVHHVAATNNPAVGVGGGGSTCAPTSLGGVPYNSALIGTYNRTSTASATMYTNGGFPNTSTCNSNFVGQNMRIGARSSSGYNPFNGNISEVIVYNRSLSALELQRVHSYLALKYGITLDQATPTDYVASNWNGTTGTKMWVAADNTGYGKDIAGLGRDSCTGLYQKQSKSVNAGTIIRMAIGSSFETSNTNNGGTIANDRSFLVWSDNGGTTTFGTAVTGLTNSTTRMNRIWKVDKTSWSDQNITICASQGGERYLLLSSDATFGAGDTELAFNFGTGCVTLNSSLLTDGSYFTLGSKIVGPACVNTNIKTWYRADYGISATQWIDYSGNANTATVASGTPTAVAAGINFNPTVAFDGVNDFFNLPTNMFGTGTGINFTVFAVSDGVGSGILSAGVNTLNQGFYLRSNSTNVNFDLSSNAGPNDPHGQGTLPRLNRYRYNGTTRYVAGMGSAATSSAATLTLASSTPKLGEDIGGTSDYNGNISEVVVYNTSTLTTTQIQQVESYLSLKYGLTLDQITPTDYLASNGITKMWTAADNTGFANDIAGIGRDDCTDLYQKQSKSVNTDDIVTVAVGGAIEVSNAANTNEIINDNSYLVWGNNDGAKDFNATVSGTTVTARLGRIWKVDKTNWEDGDINLCFTGFDDKNYLIISNASSTFATINKEVQLDGGGCISINSADLPDGAYFTLGRNIIGPACVNGGVKVWLRADNGSAIGSLWTDFSNNGNSATQATVANQPIADAATMNFNPSLDFDGATDIMGINFDINPSVNDVITAYTVYNADIPDAADGLWGNDNGVFDRYLYIDKYASGGASPAYAGGNIAATNLMVGARYDEGAASGSFVWVNGTQAVNFTQSGSEGGVTTMSIGSTSVPSGNPFNGKIAEFVLYNRALTAVEKQKVESYLALKYGITLNTGATDYVASNWDGSTGTKMWDATVNASYNKDIAGIGRDSCTGLNQKQSKSVNSGSFVSIALGTSVAASNPDNTSTITNDRSFFVWGNNAGTTTFNQVVPVLTGVTSNMRMARTWKVDKTNWDDQDITVCVSQNGERSLLVDKGNGLFNTDGDVTQYDFGFTTGCVTLNTDQIPDGAYFTIATKIAGPACVNTNIRAWYRADYGISATQWIDYSGNSNTATVASGTPTAVATGINFNSTVAFDGVNDFFNLPTNMFGTGTGLNFTVFAVSDGVGSSLLSAGVNTTNQAFYLRSNNTNVNFDLASNVGPNDPHGQGTLPRLNRYRYDGTTRYVAGMGTAATSSAGALNLASSTPKLGEDITGSNDYNGNISEVVVYNTSTLTSTQIQQIESYLSLKYGLTLNNGATDYIASDGTTIMWDASDNTGYDQNIAGIGLDQCTELNQKQSRSVNTTNSGNVLTVALGSSVAASNAANANSITTDNTFLVWGDNGGTLNYLSTASGINANTRLSRVWKVDKSSTSDATSPEPANWDDQEITLCFTGYDDKAYLIISNSDAAFGTVDYEAQLGTDGCVIINTSSLPDQAYFTLGVTRQGPACVNAGIAAWLRADVNATDMIWNDVSGNEIVAAAVNAPTVSTAALNYNPALVFDGTNDYMSFSPLTTLPYGSSNRTIIGVSYTSTASGIRSIMSYGTATDNQNQRIGQNATAARYSSGTAAAQIHDAAAFWTLNTPSIMATTYEDKATDEAYIYKDGGTGTLKSVTTPWNTNATGAVGRIGANTIAAPTEYWQGGIGEVVVYNRVLSATERRQVESYLAIKYGITLSVASASTAYDYLASDGLTTSWSAVDNFGFHNDLAGLGLDECTGLNQKQSRSINSDDVITMALGSSVAADNASNANTITTDKSFLVWGNNDGSTNVFTTPVTGVAEASIRMARIWKVDKTNWTDQNITVCFQGQVGERYLLVDDNDAAMGSVDRAIKLDINTGCITINSDKLPDGAYFSLGTRIDGPGCVGSDGSIRVWLRADYGASATSWNDFSGRSNHATQATVANQPTTTGLLNYNKSMDFAGDDYMSMPVDINSGTVDPITVMAVYEADVASRHVWGNDNTGEDRYLRMANVANGVSSTPYTGGNVTAIPKLVTTIMDEEATNVPLTSYVYVDGAQALNFNQTGSSGGLSTLNIGNINASATTAFDGRIAEFAVFSGALSSTQRRQAESYLALKYGISLEVTSASAAYNYLASDGTTAMWSAVDNFGYQYDIAGLGRDECTELYQKQSKSANSNLLRVALGSAIQTNNLENTGTIDEDQAFLVWGHNNGSLNYTTNVSSVISNTRLGRVWKADKTLNWNDQDITMCFTGYDDKTYLLISDDAGFATVSQEFQLSGSGCVTFNTGSLPDGAYFTLGSQLYGPACVNGGIQLWLRADVTANATDWTGVSGNGVVATTVGSPSLTTGILNFNPGYVLNGTSQYLTLSPLANLPYGSTNRTIIGVGYSSNVTGVRSILSYGTATNNENQRIGQNAAAGRYSSGTGAGQFVDAAGFWTASTTSIMATTYTDAATDVAAIYKDGKSVISSNITTPWNTNATGAVGRIGANTIAVPTEYWSGGIGEVIVYNRVLSAVELQQVNSYLALKYGITLDQTVAQDYLASDGITKMWDATVNGLYKNDIAGIGLDECTGLNQKQSKSINSNSRVTIGLGTIETTNALNANTFASDKSFLVWGHDNGGTTETSTELPASLSINSKRLAREWKVQETGTVGNVQVKIDLTSITITATSAAEIKLMIDRDGDGDFTTGIVDLVDASSYTSNIATFDNVDFINGDIFAIASKVPEIMLSGEILLQGPYDVGSHLLNTTLNSLDVLPQTDPYGLGISATVDPNTIGDIVDWIKIEVRDATTPSTILKEIAAFVKSDGTLVGLDGVSTLIGLGNLAPASYHISIRHRNHLGVMTATAINFGSGSGSVDFISTSPSHGVYGSGGRVEVEPGVWAMWGGEANVDGYVYDASDPAGDIQWILINALGGDANSFLSNIYHQGDVNMDGYVYDASDPAGDVQWILINVLGGDSNNFVLEQLP